MEHERLIRVLGSAAPQDQPSLAKVDEAIGSCEKLTKILLQTKMCRGPLDLNDGDDDFQSICPNKRMGTDAVGKCQAVPDCVVTPRNRRGEIIPSSSEQMYSLTDASQIQDWPVSP